MTAMNMTNVLINFRRYLKRRNYSRHTVKYYLSILKKYVLWLPLPLEQATDKQIGLFIDYLHRKRMKPASINLYLTVIRVFYSYLKYEENIRLSNPAKSGFRLRVGKALPRFLKDHEVEKLFAVITCRRDLAMFKLMLRCGLRVEEVANLSMGPLI